MSERERKKSQITKIYQVSQILQRLLSWKPSYLLKLSGAKEERSHKRAEKKNETWKPAKIKWQIFITFFFLFAHKTIIFVLFLSLSFDVPGGIKDNGWLKMSVYSNSHSQKMWNSNCNNSKFMKQIVWMKLHSKNKQNSQNLKIQNVNQKPKQKQSKILAARWSFVRFFEKNCCSSKQRDSAGKFSKKFPLWKEWISAFSPFERLQVFLLSNELWPAARRFHTDNL